MPRRAAANVSDALTVNSLTEVHGQDQGEGKTMSKPTPVGNPIYSLLPTEVEGFGPLAELALDMLWSWSHYADDVWRQLDPALWELTQNPWAVLQTVSRDKLRHMLADPVFREKVDALVQTSRQAAEAPAWFQQTYAQSPLTCVVYFSMEFMLSEALPIYSGGLGNVAGDQLKAASDLGVPVVAVGLLYQQGYFRQVIDKDGAQQALFPYNDPGQLPITPLREPSGDGCNSNSTCLVTRSGFASGKSKWAESSFTSWTVMTSRTSPPTAALPANFTGAARICG